MMAVAKSSYAADLYAGLFQELSQDTAPALLAGRQKSLDALLQRGIPNRKVEAYRYFSLRELSESRYSWLAARQGFVGFTKADLPVMNMAETNLVMVNGVYFGCFGKTSEALSVEVLPLMQPATCTADLVSDGDEFLASLLNLFSQQEIRVKIAASSQGLKVVVHELVRAAKPAFFVNKLHFVVSDDADLLVQLIGDPARSGNLKKNSEGSHHNIAHLQVEVGQRASCRVFADWSNDASGYALRLVNAQVQAAGNFQLASLSSGRNHLRCNTRITLQGEESHCGLYGLVYAQDHDLFDHHTHITHAAAQTKSRQIYKLVGQDSSRSIFNGRIHVVPGVSAIDAHQLVRGLLSSADAEIDAKPDLRIESDDVKCSHGASIGGINPDQLFYCRSRGLDEAQAKVLLARGFLDDLVERIPDAALRDLFHVPLDSLLKREGTLNG